MTDKYGRAAPNARAVMVGGVWLNGDCNAAINRVAELCGPVLWGKVKAEGRVSQGYSSKAWGGKGVAASGSTHDSGHAIDVITDRHSGHGALSQSEAATLVTAFQRAGFEAALRVRGYDLGDGSRVRTEHVHAALRGRSNAALLALSTLPDGPAYLDKMLAARQRYA